MKHCNGCNLDKPLEEFHRRGKSFQSKCKSCKSEMSKNRTPDQKRRQYLKAREWVVKNPEKVSTKARRYRKRHPERKRYDQAKRRKRTPPWLTQSQLQQIKDVYWLARDLEVTTGEEYHVDHIVPLNGENVSGLHVPWNLQVLPSDLNMSKGNKLDTRNTSY